jgi:hypothetical protein
MAYGNRDSAAVAVLCVSAALLKLVLSVLLFYLALAGF